MSTTSQEISQRRAASGGKPSSVFGALEQMKPQFARALPASVSVEQFMRLALNEVRSNPQLGTCTQESLMGALMVAARLNLEVGGPLGQFYLTVRHTGRGRERVATVVPIIGYQGLRDLAYRSGQVDSIQSVLIREGDTFRHGANEQRGRWFEYEPSEDDDAEDAPWTGVLALARIKGGGVVWRRLTHKQVMARKAAGSAGDRGPWSQFEEAMAMKTGLRALSPDLPKSSALALAFRVDESPQEYRDGDTADRVADVAPPPTPQAISQRKPEPEPEQPMSTPAPDVAAGEDIPEEEPPWE